MSDRYELSLVNFNNHTATFRNHEKNPFNQFVVVQIDRDKFNALGKPGYITVDISITGQTGIAGCGCGCETGPQCTTTDGVYRCMSTAGHKEDHDFDRNHNYGKLL